MVPGSVVEQFGGLVSALKGNAPEGRPVPITMDGLEEYVDGLATRAKTGKDNLANLAAANLLLTNIGKTKLDTSGVILNVWNLMTLECTPRLLLFLLAEQPRTHSRY